ncbi:MFS transporter [Niabella beijingensis]|uniref:MFS transporter n=1 Tax=Niabella beijingensis TaxID=2872700 RepID=UPI001CC03230|nr:MFS transporter [Niabella beijingensis]MBZ4187983.1 MFS transporter [Niabella beijingensis]
MRKITKGQTGIPTVLAFLLIPISGLAMDIYIPSFPQMVEGLHTTASHIRLTMTVYLISYGVSQLFVGSLVDSFGRYRIGMTALALFVLTNFLITQLNSINWLLITRGIQGFLLAIIMVAKRSFFIDVYEGEKQKHYTSLLSIVWSAAPILAPFLGGYLEHFFGWRSNFYFLGIYALILLILEGIFSGETLKERRPFRLNAILGAYRQLLSARDFSYGILILGLCYSMVIVFNMAAPFIIENVFHYTAVQTGYSALVSGLALLAGGLFGKWLIQKPFFRKLRNGLLVQLGIAVIMYLAASYYHHILFMMVFVALLHFQMGYIYNCYFTYCLTRFPGMAGMSGGVTSGGSYIVTSIASYAIVSVLNVYDIGGLSVSYVTLSLLIGVMLLLLYPVVANRMRESLTV